MNRIIALSDSKLKSIVREYSYLLSNHSERVANHRERRTGQSFESYENYLVATLTAAKKELLERETA